MGDDKEVTRITKYKCPVEPTGMHRYLEESRLVYVLHPRCAHCGFINVEVDLEAIREGVRRDKSLQGLSSRKG